MSLRTTDFVAKWALFCDHKPHLQTQAAWSQMQTGLQGNRLGIRMDHKGRSQPEGHPPDSRPTILPSWGKWNPWKGLWVLNSCLWNQWTNSLKEATVLCISHVCPWLAISVVELETDAEQTFPSTSSTGRKHIMSQHTRGCPVTCWGAWAGAVPTTACATLP